MVLRKVVAFIGLLGVISALAWQHGMFDRAVAAAPEPQVPSQTTAQSQPQAQPQTKMHPKMAANRSRPKRTQ